MMNPMERDVMAKTMAYMLALKSWQQTEGVHSHVGDPLLGQWELSDGSLLEFDSGVFTWYRHADDMTGDCRSGAYYMTPGILANRGFILDRRVEATQCFSVFLSYTHDRLNGVDQVVDFRGLLFVDQLGSLDSVGIYNHRTDWRYEATRVTT